MWSLFYHMGGWKLNNSRKTALTRNELDIIFDLLPAINASLSNKLHKYQSRSQLVHFQALHMEHPPLSANSEKKMPASKRTSVVGNRSHAKAQASGGSCLVTRKVTTVERSAEKALLSIGLSEENDEENQKWSDDTQFVSSQTAFFPKTRFNFLKQLAHYMDTDGYTTAPEQQQVVLLPTPVESVISDCNFTRQLRSTVKVQPNAKISPYLPYQPLFSETTTNVRNNHFEE